MERAMDEKWRAECEARQVLKWPKERRAKYYAMVVEKRGTAAAQALRDAVNVEWKRRQASSSLR